LKIWGFLVSLLVVMVIDRRKKGNPKLLDLELGGECKRVRLHAP
jgi:hypothetical protein